MLMSKSMKVFVILYQEKNLKLAAEKLCLSVPPVSRMLKLTEEWLGRQLFIIKKNQLIPTSFAERLYIQLLPSYHIINSVKPLSTESSLEISSPYSNTSLMNDLLYPIFQSLVEPLSVKQSESICDNDDIFISFHNSTCSAHFEKIQVRLTLSLICQNNNVDNWMFQRLFVEGDILDQQCFKKTLKALRCHGYKGVLHRTDSVTCLKTSFIMGRGMCFKLSNAIPTGVNVLPFVLYQPLFVYINKIKRNSSYDFILSNIVNCENFDFK